MNKISKLKTNLIFPENYNPTEFFTKIVSRVYNGYQAGLKKMNGLDFDDLIVLTVKMFKQNPDILEKYQNYWKYILVDEYQDTSHDQYTLINLLSAKNRNIFAIGDDAQCFLPGTKIKTEVGLKNIEDITKGTSIISPAGRGHAFATQVLSTKKSHYNGMVLEIKTKKGYSIKTTSNHVFFGKLLPSENFYITYLMHSQKIGYRIGVTIGVRHPRSGKSSLGLAVRANQEKSDKMWILKLSPTRSDAQYWEAYYAFKYGIPTTIFFANRGKGSTPMLITQEHIDKLFKSIPTEERAKNLMDEECISFLYPHHRPQGTIKYDTRRITVNLCYFSSAPSNRTVSKFRGARVGINNKDKNLKNILKKAGLKTRNGKAGTWRIETSHRNNGDAELLADKIASLCNIEISKRALVTNISFDFMPASHLHPHMTVPIFDGNKFVNDQVISVKKLHYKGYVYDLNIERSHTYTANNFAVHNSIYAFRDADIRNILNFQKDYPDAKVIFLEQNYRSTKNILAAAQNIISNNQTQVPKELWTENTKGEKIHVRETLNERAEAEFIVDKMDELLEKNGHKIQDFTVLYRTHAQSRAIEEALITRGFPYQIVGGIRFYERREIKDILSYLRFMVNPTDLISFERIFNVPTRGIGETTFNKIVAINEKDLIQSIGLLAKERGDTKQAKALTEFKKLLTDLLNKKDDKNLTSVIKYVIKRVGYEDYLKALVAKKELYDNTADKMENLKELLTVSRKYDMLKGEEGIEKFLEEIALLQETDKMKASADRVTLMTIHSSKGLEFPVVFIAGMEEGLFPHSRATLAPLELEEERRLCYVAITRAKDRLIITHAKYRSIFGSTQTNLPSRFIYEMPQDVLQIQPLFESSHFDDDVIEY